MRIRILCTLLVLALLAGCGTVEPSPTTVPTVPATTAPPVTEPQPTLPPHEADYGMEPSERWIPFVYDASDLGLRLELGTKGLVSTSDLADGGFYVLDREQKTAHPLEPTGVSLHLETPNTVFYLLNGRTLIQSDFTGLQKERLYEAAADIACMERLDSLLYLAEGGSAVLLDLATGEATPLFQASVITSLLPLTPQLLLWTEGEDEYRLYDHDLKETQTLSRMEYNFLRSALSALASD